MWLSANCNRIEMDIHAVGLFAVCALRDANRLPSQMQGSINSLWNESQQHRRISRTTYKFLKFVACKVAVLAHLRHHERSESYIALVLHQLRSQYYNVLRTEGSKAHSFLNLCYNSYPHLNPYTPSVQMNSMRISPDGQNFLYAQIPPEHNPRSTYSLPISLATMRPA